MLIPRFFSIWCLPRLYLVIKNNMETCDPCCLVKSHKLSFSLSETKANKPLEFVHYDVWGQSPVTSHSGLRYYVLFTDKFFRFNWIYCIARKSDVSAVFNQFKLLVKNLLFATIKTIQLDGDTEFKPMMRAHLHIQFHISCPYTPEQNGLVECKTQTNR
jgi:hypothetical protein